MREVRRDFDRRVDEISAELKESGPEAVEEVGMSLDELKEDLQDSFAEIQLRLEDRLETGRREVREHPLLAVGVAVVVGAIVGMLLGKRKDVGNPTEGRSATRRRPRSTASSSNE